MIKFMKWTLTNFAFASCVLAMSPAFSEAGTRTVAYGDLNLASSAGRATLDHRIGRAVDAVCGRSLGWDTPAAGRAIGQCRAKALLDANTQMASLIDPSRQFASRHGAVLIASR